MDTDEKICPRCAETVKSAALVCKHCQHEFGTPIQTTPSETPPISATVAQKKRHPILIGCASIVGFVVFLAIVSSIFGQSNNPPSSASTETTTDAPEGTTNSTEAPTKVTALELARAYAANEVAAQQTYGGKTLDVTGTVSGITLDLFSNPVVQFASNNEFLPVQAAFDKSFSTKLGKLSKGDTATVRCTSITEVISAPQLSDCILP